MDLLEKRSASLIIELLLKRRSNTVKTPFKRCFNSTKIHTVVFKKTSEEFLKTQGIQYKTYLIISSEISN